jgi:predicted dienelactone hydrolase
MKFLLRRQTQPAPIADPFTPCRPPRKTPRPASALALALAAATAMTAAAAAGATVVGTTTLDLTDASRQRSVVSELWFEAAPGTAADPFAPLPPLKSLPLALGAKPAATAARKPLIVISHGNWASRYAYAWLATELVKAGYLVLSPSHPGTMFGDLRPEFRARLWERSLDVSFALGQLLADPVWSAQIDPQRIGFVGHSFGGWTGVSLAGGLYSYARQLQACKDLPQKDLYCTNLIQDYNPATPVADGSRSFKDTRFKAFYLMASGVAAGFDEASLKAIDRPMVLDTAVGDPILSPELGSSLFARLIPTAIETRREVGHFSYGPLCKPLIGRVLAGQVCEDPAGVERAATHAQVAADAVRFFKARL